MCYYTGVGSRTTPPDTLAYMQRIASWLRLMGYVLRSGGADGADTAFEQGASGQSHIYLPWPGFNGRVSCELPRPSVAAYTLAAEVHPAWSRLTGGPRALHARDCHQVLGNDLSTPSDFLICWTPDGCIDDATRSKNTGGTSTAIVLASRRAIPVFNLQRPGAMAALERFVVRMPVGQS